MVDRTRRAGAPIDTDKLDKVVAQARQQAEKRLQGYREQSLRIHPWICGRCGREFTRENLHELTVHHKDHNHDNNPPDGSNWENLCLYCHDNEHQRYEEFVRGYDGMAPEPENKPATFNPFADLKSLLNKDDSQD
ncbi:MAG TPA: YajD family HNH nuclease [Gammaproteobacteria bacterium]